MVATNPNRTSDDENCIEAPDGTESTLGEWVALLNPNQLAALKALADGQTISGAAEAAKVNRNTVTSWMKTCAPFRAAYNAWRQGVIESTQAKLLQAAEAAASVVAQTLREGDGRFALSVLKYLQLGRGPTPGPTDLKLAADEVAILHEEERHVQHKRADAAGNDRLLPRRRESYEALVERVKERQREAAEEAAALKRPTPGGTSDH